VSDAAGRHATNNAAAIIPSLPGLVSFIRLLVVIGRLPS
jgi:hypothetical protein